MNIAIIGANGFIGARLVEIFHLGGRHQVVPVVRRPSALALAARFDVDWRLGDALDAKSLAAALAGCDVVVHAALGDPRQIEAMPAVLCAAAAAAGVNRVVYLSSASVHGQAPAAGTTEASPLHTRHALEYNNAKVRAERSFFLGCARHGLAGFALRPGVVFGPRSRWISDLAADLRGHRAALLGAGDGICNTLYVDNLAEAVALALTAPADAAGPYLVGDPDGVTWGDFYRLTADALGIARDTIHPVGIAPEFPVTGRERVARWVASPVVQALLPAAPSRLKRLGKQLIAAFTPPPAGAGSWQLPSRPRPRLTRELSLLQQNHWPLPSDLARRRLGFRPSLTFVTGLERSLAWLAFAEGRA